MEVSLELWLRVVLWGDMCSLGGPEGDSDDIHLPRTLDIPVG